MNTEEPSKISLWNNGIEKTPAQKLAFFLMLTGIFWIIGQFVTLGVFLLGGVNPSDLAAILKDGSHYQLMQIAQVVGSVFVFILPVFCFMKMVKPTSPLYVNVKTPIDSKQLIFVVILALTGMYVGDLLAQCNEWIPISKSLRHSFQQLEDSYNGQVQILLHLGSVSDLIFSLFLIALFPAMCEELFFRGVLQSIFVEWTKRPWFGIMITAILFSLIHMSYFGFLPRFFLGMSLGLIYYYGKNLKLNILVHFLNNAIAVVQMYQVAKLHGGKIPIEAMDAHENLFTEICTSVVFLCILYMYIKHSKSKNLA